MTTDDQAWLAELAVKYKVLESTSERLDSDAFAELNALAVKHTDDLKCPRLLYQPQCESPS